MRTLINLYKEMFSDNPGFTVGVTMLVAAALIIWLMFFGQIIVMGNVAGAIFFTATTLAAVGWVTMMIAL